ncbi:MAG: matrixin family metalloprotease, partial [Ilumatobacteraceae bacterium]
APTGSVSVDLTSFGVPADASAAVLNVTATNTWATGFLTVWPSATPMPVASNLNMDSAGQSVANQVIARITGGSVDVYSSSGADVIVDVSGYVTGGGAPESTEGLYVPLAPVRMLDTRTVGAFSTGVPIGSRTTKTLPMTGRGGVPINGVLAVAANVTATQTQAPGYVTAWPANTPIPATSSVNFTTAGRSVANHVIASLNGGAVNFYSQGGTHLLVDLFGYWTGPSTTAPPSTGSHDFLYVGQTSYGRWNPCEPIDYVVDPYGADQAMLDQLDLAIGQVENATGLDFVYAGTASVGQNPTPPPGADAVLGFSDAARTKDLAGNVIGIGGGSFNPATGRVTSGFAIADVQGVESAAKLQATFLHEIAHMVGLAHVSDPSQLMYFSATSVSTYQDGDLEGLWRVGSSQGCLAADAPLADAPQDTVLVVET